MLDSRIPGRTPDSILYTEIWKDATFTDEERFIYPCVALVAGVIIFFRSANSHVPGGLESLRGRHDLQGLVYQYGDIRMLQVSSGFDVVDDEIVKLANEGNLVITSDIP
jgi:hypothetical protein